MGNPFAPKNTQRSFHAIHGHKRGRAGRRAERTWRHRKYWWAGDRQDLLGLMDGPGRAPAGVTVAPAVLAAIPRDHGFWKLLGAGPASRLSPINPVKGISSDRSIHGVCWHRSHLVKGIAIIRAPCCRQLARPCRGGCIQHGRAQQPSNLQRNARTP